MAFRPNEISHDHNHGVVCDNSPILCTCVHHGMAINVAEGRFRHLYQKKSIFSFSKGEKRVVV